jgi:hypothetical protein
VSSVVSLSPNVRLRLLSADDGSDAEEEGSGGAQVRTRIGWGLFGSEFGSSSGTTTHSSSVEPALPSALAPMATDKTIKADDRAADMGGSAHRLLSLALARLHGDGELSQDALEQLQVLLGGEGERFGASASPSKTTKSEVRVHGVESQATSAEYSNTHESHSSIDALPVHALYKSPAQRRTKSFTYDTKEIRLRTSSAEQRMPTPDSDGEDEDQEDNGTLAMLGTITRVRTPGRTESPTTTTTVISTTNTKTASEPSATIPGPVTPGHARRLSARSPGFSTPGNAQTEATSSTSYRDYQKRATTNTSTTSTSTRSVQAETTTRTMETTTKTLRTLHSRHSCTSTAEAWATQRVELEARVQHLESLMESQESELSALRLSQRSAVSVLSPNGTYFSPEPLVRHRTSPTPDALTSPSALFVRTSPASQHSPAPRHHKTSRTVGGGGGMHARHISSSATSISVRSASRVSRLGSSVSRVGKVMRSWQQQQDERISNLGSRIPTYPNCFSLTPFTPLFLLTAPATLKSTKL